MALFESRSQRWSLIVVALCSLAWAQRVHGVAARKILETWQEYDAALDSAQFVCDISRTRVATVGVPDFDPYAPAGSMSVKLQQSVTISISGRQLASHRIGENWDPSQSRKVFQNRIAGFDGKETRTLYTNGPTPLANVCTKEQPGEILANSVELKPVLLACSPYWFLETNGFQVDDAKLVDRVPLGDLGAETLVLSIPGQHQDHVAYVYVAKDDGHRVICVEEQYQNKTRRNVFLDYKEDARLGWIISSWKLNHFRPVGGPSLAITGRVLASTIGERIDAKVFHPEFPVGTHVAVDNIEYFIQASNGMLAPLDEGEYGSSLAR